MAVSTSVLWLNESEGVNDQVAAPPAVITCITRRTPPTLVVVAGKSRQADERAKWPASDTGGSV